MQSFLTAIRAKRRTGGPFWRMAFSVKDFVNAVKAARHLRLREAQQKAGLIREVAAYGRRPSPPAPRHEDFHLRSAVLKTHQDAVAAISEVRSLGLEPHDGTDRKNWDTLAAVSAILQTTGPEARVLDAGAALKSKILPWLSAYGYRALFGVDLSFRSALRVGNIMYEQGDLTRTRFADGYFDAVTCISVIEHGVDIQRYFQEMRRILKPGGLLITSTDYWPETVDTTGLMAGNAPWRIFDRQGIRQVVNIARSRGFILEGDVDLDAKEQAVAWNNRHYTFIYFALRKGG
jgi:SAM-dependent methyltransferase